MAIQKAADAVGGTKMSDIRISRQLKVIKADDEDKLAEQVNDYFEKNPFLRINVISIMAVKKIYCAFLEVEDKT